MMTEEGMVDFLMISKINLITKALRLYEQIRYGNDNTISFDASVDEVLRIMKVE